MNKILPAFLLIFCTTIFNAKAQLKDTAQPMIKHQVNTDLLFQKAKTQKTTAWIFLGAGTGVAIAGYAVAEHTANNDNIGFLESASLKTGVIMLLAGGASMIASIPFFISSGNNRRRANVSLKNESASISRQLHFKGNFISAGISFSL